QPAAHAPTAHAPAPAETATPTAIAPSAYQVARPAEQYERISAPARVCASSPSAYTRSTPAVAAVSVVVNAPRWKSSPTICGAHATTVAVPSSTTAAASAKIGRAHV